MGSSWSACEGGATWSRPLSQGEAASSPGHRCPPLSTLCPFQYEAVMDRVQKSKLSLYKKTMEVSSRSGRRSLDHRSLARPGWNVPPV